MTSRFVSIAACALIAGAACAPFSTAQAQHVSVRIDTPELGVRFGTPYPYPVYGPVYPAPVYPATVYAPPVIVAPAPVYYYPAPRYVVGPPRVFLPAPIHYRQPWFVPPGHAHRYWRTKHHHHD
jgi:hypothetical protein